MTCDSHIPSLFGDEDDARATTTRVVEPMMSDATRGQVRQAFARLGVMAARDQFAVVAELTDQRITSVAEMTQRQAKMLHQGILLRPAGGRTAHLILRAIRKIGPEMDTALISKEELRALSRR